MRSVVTFLIGFVFGATGALLYVHEASAGAPKAALTSRGSAPSPVKVAEAAALHIPVQGIKLAALRSNFREPRGNRTHHAIDILAPRGTPVVAATDGTIRKLFTSKAGGLTIYQYDVAEEKCYYYAHLDRYADGLREGLTVRRGDVIGYVGTSGNAPKNAPHLHFAITILPSTKEWWKGEAIDPYPLLIPAVADSIGQPAGGSR